MTRIVLVRIVSKTKQNKTLEFLHLVGGCPQDGNANLRIETDGIAVHSRILVDNPYGPGCGGNDFNFGFGALRLSVENLKFRKPADSRSLTLTSSVLARHVVLSGGMTISS